MTRLMRYFLFGAVFSMGAVVVRAFALPLLFIAILLGGWGWEWAMVHHLPVLAGLVHVEHVSLGGIHGAVKGWRGEA